MNVRIFTLVVGLILTVTSYADEAKEPADTFVCSRISKIDITAEQLSALFENCHPPRNNLQDLSEQRPVENLVVEKSVVGDDFFQTLKMVLITAHVNGIAVKMLLTRDQFHIIGNSESIRVLNPNTVTVGKISVRR